MRIQFKITMQWQSRNNNSSYEHSWTWKSFGSSCSKVAIGNTFNYIIKLICPGDNKSYLTTYVSTLYILIKHFANCAFFY